MFFSRKLNKTLYVYGRFPALNEVGGVTTYTYNVAMLLDKESTHFIDMWNSDLKEIPPGVSYSVIDRKSFWGVIEWFNFILTTDTVHFFNFSSIKACSLFSVLPKLKGSHWIGVFHHGEQEGEYINENAFSRYLIRRGLNKFEKVGYISDLQCQFYTKIYTGSLQKISPYIVPLNPDVHPPKVDSVKKSILLSGFPSSIYRIIETLGVLEELSNSGYVFSVSVCIYGEANLSPTENLSEEIKSFVNSVSWASLYSHVSSQEFKEIMQNSSTYIRMNSEDSFGLVVAEAVEAGLDVIATSVCERYPGAHLVEKDDFIGLKHTLESYFNDVDLANLLEVQSSSQDPTPLSSFCVVSEINK